MAQEHSDSVYWLLLSLSTFDSLCGLGLALVRGRFCLDKFKRGVRKLVGCVLLVFPLLLTDHFLSGNPQEAVYEYLKNWCLLYMSAVELASIGGHLKQMGLPVPSMEDLKKFRGLFKKNL